MLGAMDGMAIDQPGCKCSGEAKVGLVTGAVRGEERQRQRNEEKGMGKLEES